MTYQISLLEIQGLHGAYDVSIPIRDNKCILVGSNGAGKTTILTALYYLLSRQWEKLVNHRFERIGITINQTHVAISHSDMLEGIGRESKEVEILRRLRTVRHGKLPDGQTSLSGILSEYGHHDIEPANDDPERSWQKISALLGQTDEPGPRRGSKLGDFDATIRQLVTGQTLFLPTYRRIERDLRAILPNLNKDLKQHQKLRRPHHGQSSHFIELVEFGMEDVEELLSRKLEYIKEQAREKLNELAGNYLRDIIRGSAGRYTSNQLSLIHSTAIDRILNRVEEQTLTEGDKHTLRDVINRLTTNPNHRPTHHEGYMAHFFVRLMEINQSLSSQEQTIQQFAATCSKYLQNKKITYDERSYSVSLSTPQASLRLSDLSSGEKQIVSLFSHMLLSDIENMDIVIDEPELSLSVEWQRSLLPDVIGTGRCSFVMAATHSPFVFDNSLDSHTYDLAELIGSRHVSR